jgi:hypothetical protein
MDISIQLAVLVVLLLSSYPVLCITQWFSVSQCGHEPLSWVQMIPYINMWCQMFANLTLVSCQETYTQSQGNPCEMCKIVLGQVFIKVLKFFSCQSFHQCFMLMSTQFFPASLFNPHFILINTPNASCRPSPPYYHDLVPSNMEIHLR